MGIKEESSFFCACPGWTPVKIPWSGMYSLGFLPSLALQQTGACWVLKRNFASKGQPFNQSLEAAVILGSTYFSLTIGWGKYDASNWAFLEAHCCSRPWLLTQDFVSPITILTNYSQQISFHERGWHSKEDGTCQWNWGGWSHLLFPRPALPGDSRVQHALLWALADPDSSVCLPCREKSSSNSWISCTIPWGLISLNIG